MMQTMRHLAKTKVLKGLMMILIVSFAFWGVGDIFRGNPLERTVAKAGKASISVQSLNQEFEQTLARARQMMGGDLTAQQAKQMGLLDKTLDGMIQRAVVDQEIKKLGIDISQQAVLDQLAAQPQFRTKDGKFNKELFMQVLDQAHVNEATFLKQGQQDLSRRQLIDVFADATKPPQSIVDNIASARGQKRTLDLITIKNASMKDVGTPDDKTLHDFYQKNGQLFTAPEYRTITIARLSGDDVLKDTVVTDDQVKKEYDTKIDQLSQPERRDILQVVLQDETKAKQLAASAKSSNNLTASAKGMGYEAVILPQAAQKDMLPELAPAFALKNDEVSEPIKSSLGWHVVQIKKITPAGRPTFEAIKKQLHDDMQRDQAVEAVTRMTNQWDDQLAAGHALEDIADGLKLRVIKIPSVDAKGKLADGKDPTELPNKEDVLKTAFGQGAGEVSPIIDDKNGNYFVIRTDEIVPSAVKPFEQVQDQIAAAWKAGEQARVAAELAQKIAQGLKDGKAPSSFAGNGVEVRTSKPISMLGDSDPELPPSALPQVFKLKKDEVAVAPTVGEQVVMRLKDVTNAAPDANADAKIKIVDEIKKDTSNELTEQYLKYLHQKFPVEINQDALESVRMQGNQGG
ncbi:MAG TPA: SurA N-terminal domain-containing protein [Alphaproteobacteria bacterium]|nr:SurA N-terminal domain-containing protein [Alphaproteobacteria bacterium]